MLLVVFKYCLPVLLGYILFVGVSGRFQPLIRPDDPADRPDWVLGLWTGVVVASALIITSHMAYRLPFETVGSLFKPVLSATLLAIVLGTLLTWRYRLSVSPICDAGMAYRTAPAQDEAICTTAGQAIGVDAEISSNDDPVLLRADILKQTALREETEKHLRITRKALAVLEAQNRDYEASRTDALIGLEEELTQTVEKCAQAESRVQEQTERCTALEYAMVDTKRELLAVRKSLRQHAQARVKAMATAQKSLAHARRALQSRASIQSRARELENTLSSRQATITGLIKALEHEKSRNDTEIEERANQLLLQQRKLQARQALEDVVSTGDGKLASRLIKRVAKARPVEGKSG